MKRAVVADVCVSELGWELMAWQGYVRWHASRADYAVVCSTRSLEPIYRDFADKFIGHTVKGVRDCHNMKDVQNVHELVRAQNDVDDACDELKELGYEIVRLKPGGWDLHLKRQLYVPFGRMLNAQTLGRKYDVVIHARNRTNKTEFTGTNYPASSWEVIAEWLHMRQLRVCCVGTVEQSLALPRADDLRGIEFDELMDVMAAARVVVGPSSGPMHLASLCKTPHVTWSHTKVAPSMGCNNKDRYERVWNPFETPVTFIPSVTPEPSNVFTAVELAMLDYPR